jgi:hypothetical protein
MSSLFSEYPPSVLERFKSFHTANPWVFRKFCEEAFKLIELKKTSYGARCILESIRHDHHKTIRGDEAFEINNDFIPIYARLFMYKFPEHLGFFKLREVKSKGIGSSEQHWREAA